MRAFIMDAPRQARIGEWPTPEPKAGEVRVAVVAAGICAGDIYIYKGVNPYVVYPAIGGHEIAGVVESVGANVEGLHEGDAVVVEPFLGCGACYPCRQGRSNCCTNLQILGAHRPGDMQSSLWLLPPISIKCPKASRSFRPPLPNRLPSAYTDAAEAM